MRGRKPLPTAVKERRGNPGHRPLNRKEAKPPPGLPKPPDFLVGEGRKEWFRISRRLFDLGLLTQVDRAVLTAYCSAWGDFADAQVKLARHGAVIVNKAGGFVVSPYLKIAERAREHLLKAASEFGMSPSSRSRVTTASGTPLNLALSLPGQGGAEQTEVDREFQRYIDGV